MFTLLPTQSSSGQALIRWGMNASDSGNAYVAMAYPGELEEDNAMVGGSAMVLQACPSCLTGAQVRQIYMSGTSSGDMQPGTLLPLANVVAEASGGQLMGAFTTEMPPPADAQEILYASGMVYRNGDIRMHSTWGVSVVDFQGGAVSDPESFEKDMSALLAAHLWLMLIGWGFLIPIGIVMARCFKNLDPFWFQSHRAIQCLGLLMGLVGFALGFVVANGWDGAFPTHRNLGIAATVFGLLQLTALVRPKLSSPLRRKWNVVHWWFGRAAAVLAVADIYYGLTKMVNTGNWGWGAYTAVIGSIVAFAILKESWAYIQLPPPAQAQASKGTLTNGNGAAPHGITNGNGAAPHGITPMSHGSIELAQ